MRSYLDRRAFLRYGSAALSCLGLGDLLRLRARAAEEVSKRADTSVILVWLSGGPSHLETYDLKPEASAEYRGEFRPIRTTVPGLDVCEHFPRLARLADRFALIRSVHHDEAPIHETGHQLMQTGRLFRAGQEHPHYGAVLSQVKGVREKGVPPFVVLPAPIGNTGVSATVPATVPSVCHSFHPSAPRAVNITTLPFFTAPRSGNPCWLPVSVSSGNVPCAVPSVRHNFGVPKKTTLGYVMNSAASPTEVRK